MKEMETEQLGKATIGQVMSSETCETDEEEAPGQGREKEMEKM